ncbi:SURF1 family protein [Microbulbifer sp. GL-2]|uniref:SURF1 family protein n=1 Tax=Microbulbifer sp. GL-2 TaxID=2591606 RepID=UPI0011659578|nr:SURF1 family protein [Microbulbifer sp. GL-2]BBM01244.1 SURF1-like protein [Microbulbifer sp. GL-2]
MRVEIPSVSAKKNSVPLIRNWPITLFSVGIFPVLISLGFWQLERAEIKDDILVEIDTRLSSQPVTPDEDLDFKRFMPIGLTGKYMDEYYFLDNRTRNGRAGYEVLQVFTSDNKRWLVNRGWIPLAEDREIFPEITYPKEVIRIIGFLYPVNKINSGKRQEKKGGQRIQSLDSQFTKELDLYEDHWSVRLSSDSISVFLTEWNLISSSAERHRAYSMQWFAMAIVLVMLWMFTATNFARITRNIISKNN